MEMIFTVSDCGMYNWIFAGLLGIGGGAIIVPIVMYIC